MKINKSIWVIIFLSLLGLAIAALVFTDFLQLTKITELVKNSGYWGYLIFIAAYVIATLLILPSTAFNIAGGAIFGGFQGLLVTSIAALTAAAIAFAIARNLKFKPKVLDSNQWGNLNEHLKAGGFPYAMAMRFFPLVPYGVVSFAAGFSQINQRDYFLGTLLGTPLGLAPFVWLGHTGVQAATGYSAIPLTITGAVLALLIMASTWYYQNQKIVDSNPPVD
jgi:uncharacterized membrane protein YdjX (TVP38/TMEM64 family)